MTDLSLTAGLPEEITAWPSYFGGMGAGYDDIAFGGAALEGLATREISFVVGALGSGSGRTLLDIGAGTGRFTSRLAAAGWSVTSFDAAPEMLAVIAERVPSARTVEGRLGDPLPFDDASFDGLVAMRVVKYVLDTESALAELSRVVAPGGTLVFDLCNRRSLARFGYKAQTVGFVTPQTLRPMLRRVGLVPVRIEAGPRLPHPLYQRARGNAVATGVAGVERVLDTVLPDGLGARSVVVHAVRSR